MSVLQSQKDVMDKTKLFREDQGFHECEVTFEDEAALQKQLSDCEKNPGHEKFIPVTEFTQDHLAPYCSSQNIFNIIQTEAALTVRIHVTHTSKDRPDNYPFCNFKGYKGSRTGTGWVRWAKDKFTEKDNKPCPCCECRRSPVPKKEWGHVYVRTAQHVVFDTSEAEHTQCMLFYDRPEDRETALVLQGVSVIQKIHTYDWSELSCVTHDLSLWDKLDELDHRRDDLFEKVKQEYLKNKNDSTSQVAVIISHPHGCSKQVSIGHWVYQHKIGQYDYTQYTYTTCTCPGSSGAPVYILGSGKLFCMTSHPHSKRCGVPGLNESATGWD